MNPKNRFFKPNSFHRSLAVCFTFFLLGLLNPGFGQEDLLKPVGQIDLGGILGEEKKVTVRLLSETDEALNVEVKYEGFREADEYVVRGAILNKDKKAMKEIPAVKRTISKGSGSTDLGFRLNLSSGQNFDQAYLGSGFVKIMIYDKSEEDGIIEIPGVETILLSGDSYLFDYQKDWRVGGSAGMVIPVTLTPIGKAGN